MLDKSVKETRTGREERKKRQSARPGRPYSEKKWGKEGKTEME